MFSLSLDCSMPRYFYVRLHINFRRWLCYLNLCLRTVEFCLSMPDLSRPKSSHIRCKKFHYFNQLIQLSWGLCINLHFVHTGQMACDAFFSRRALYLVAVSRLTNRSFIREEIQSRLTSGNACYHSVQNVPSSSLVDSF